MQPGTLPPPPARPSILQRRVGGIPMPVVIVGVVAVGAYLYLRHKQKASSSTSGGSAPVSTCVAVDQFGNCIESGLTPYGPYSYDTGGYGGYGYGGITGQPPPSNSTTPNTPTPPPPAPAPPKAFNPYVVGSLVAPGEKIISSAYDPSGQGGIDLTSLGGVYTFGNQRFYGSAFNPKMPLAPGTQIVATPGGGYQINEPSGPVKFGP